MTNGEGLDNMGREPVLVGVDDWSAIEKTIEGLLAALEQWRPASQEDLGRRHRNRRGPCPSVPPQAVPVTSTTPALNSWSIRVPAR
jgi:hypothetical protein